MPGVSAQPGGLNGGVRLQASRRQDRLFDFGNDQRDIVFLVHASHKTLEVL